VKLGEVLAVRTRDPGRQRPISPTRRK
jgi:hypothetical protein